MCFNTLWTTAKVKCCSVMHVIHRRFNILFLIARSIKLIGIFLISRDWKIIRSFQIFSLQNRTYDVSPSPCLFFLLKSCLIMRVFLRKNWRRRIILFLWGSKCLDSPHWNSFLQMASVCSCVLTKSSTVLVIMTIRFKIQSICHFVFGCRV